jgi:DNA (cytosine-5)-methyltransferase 1
VPTFQRGKGAGFDDERHLWPAFQHLIRECKPSVVIGEQVASKDAEPWIDLVHTDMEALGYAFGAIPFPSASVGAPHIRDRLYWCGTLANANNAGLEGRVGVPERAVELATGEGCVVEWMADSDMQHKSAAGNEAGIELRRRSSSPSGMDDTQSIRSRFLNTENVRAPDAQVNIFADAGNSEPDQPQGERLAALPAGPTNGFWRDVDWLGCRDGKWRPVEPGTFPLAHGASARVVRLRAYGNAINAQAAQIFVECVIDAQRGIA